MKIIRSLQAMTAWSEALRREGVTIGFVPTMGALHDGHRALIRAARLQCDALVVSIFVNPTQFGPQEDLATYPRPIAKDRALCRAEGVDVCFEPTAASMYPEGFQTVVTVPAIARRWEGESRPRHFVGVAAVVTKLFGIVRPHRAVFGQKDYQQAAVIRRLIEDLNLDITLDVRATVREHDGLAMSSRNVYLSTEQRRIAPVFYRALQAGRRAIEEGATDTASVREVMQKVIAEEPTIQIDYLAVCDPITLEPTLTIGRHAVLLGAIRIGSVRLIDTVMVKRSAR
ncbi:MAG TPA: pantoate--beta-alanine ligase [Nitrospiraceae bacterium]|nr:pantoate--beta-alanine ligase [Nitrospiraceae bacterium]